MCAILLRERGKRGCSKKFRGIFGVMDNTFLAHVGGQGHKLPTHQQSQRKIQTIHCSQRVQRKLERPLTQQGVELVVSS